MCWLSVITPVLDAHEEFQTTLESLKHQATTEIEWIVVDSSNNRQEIGSLLESVHQFPIQYVWVPQQGIFSAMNTGLVRASGQYSLFLNAGDTILSDESLERVRKSLVDLGEPPWAYADVAMSSDLGQFFVPSPWHFESERKHLFARGRFPCHQGTFAKTEILLSLGGFNSDYEIAGDYELFLRLSEQFPHSELPFAVAQFSPGGASSSHWLRGIKEFHQARRKVFAPTGFRAVREVVETMMTATKVILYRTLWAPNRPLHKFVRGLDR